MATPSLHFDGPMIAGGSAYGLDEIQASPEPQRALTGVAFLDELTGGIEPGAVWAVTGPSGSGVTSLASAVAVGVSTASQVVVCNGHTPTRTLTADLIERLGHDRPGGGRDRLHVASWFGLCQDPPDEQMPFNRTDLLVVDTWDETWHTRPWPVSRAELIRPLRWFRHVMHENNTAVLLTSRTPSSPSEDALGWMSEAFDDIADVRIDLQWRGDDVQALVRTRGGRTDRGTLRTVPRRRTRITRD